jgi:hypothetical protein
LANRPVASANLRAWRLSGIILAEPASRSRTSPIMEPDA